MATLGSEFRFAAISLEKPLAQAALNRQVFSVILAVRRQPPARDKLGQELLIFVGQCRNGHVCSSVFQRGFKSGAHPLSVIVRITDAGIEAR